MKPGLRKEMSDCPMNPLAPPSRNRLNRSQAVDGAMRTEVRRQTKS